MTEALMTISQLAGLFQIKHHTIRHYEDKGLLSPLEKSENGYRKYGLAEAYQLAFILFLKDLGLSLIEIKTLLAKEEAHDYESLLVQKQKDISTEQVRLRELSKRVDQQLAIIKQGNRQEYRVNQSINLRSLKELPIEQAFDLSVMQSLDHHEELLLGNIYYFIFGETYHICIEAAQRADFEIESGTYQLATVTSTNHLEMDRQLGTLMAEHKLPLIVIEDNGRFLTKGSEIAVKVLGDRHV